MSQVVMVPRIPNLTLLRIRSTGTRLYKTRAIARPLLIAHICLWSTLVPDLGPEIDQLEAEGVRPTMHSNRTPVIEITGPRRGRAR
jgi:hypothetical protein